MCVAHFPNIHASSLEEARDYCRQKTESLLLAYSLIRDAAGEVFEIVVVDRKSGQSTKYSVSGSYTGNLLTGQLAGESSETMQTLIKGMAADPLSEFLVNLYKQGRQERNPDFQYLRFWQILEILAASKNYDEDADLLDYQGQEMMDGSNIRKCRGHVHTVFALFRDEGMGSSIETWRNVNIWYAFRSAVAHYGGVARFGALSRANVRVWAERGFDEISNAGHDKYLWQLKEDVKMLLKRRLVRMG